ncbi:MAG TPA: hypothetical protein VF411_01785 [Bacteroidia bacterium]
MSNSMYGSTQVERSEYFARVHVYLNLPAVIARLGTAASFAGNMAIYNHLYTNPNPVLPETSPDNLGYLELLPIHTSISHKKDPLITGLFHQRERKQKGSTIIGLEDILRLIYGDIPDSVLNATDRSTLNLHLKKPATTTSISTEATGRLAPMYISMKHQIHLSIEFEITYPGTTSKALQKGVKEAMMYMYLQAASITTIPDPRTTAYTYIGDLKRGTLTQNFTEAQEGMAALVVMQEKSKGKKATLSNYTKVFRIVVS